MATEVLPTTDTAHVLIGARETDGSSEPNEEVTRRLVHSMWRPSRSLAQSGVLGVDLTQVSQNGISTKKNTDELIRRLKPSPVHVPTPRVPLDRFRMLANWIGRVQRVYDDTFVALVQDQLEDRPEEEAELLRDEVASVDQPLLVPGAVFYWSIGYRDRLAGPRIRESVIRFRRLPKPSSDDLAKAAEWARDILSLMDNEPGQSSSATE